MSRDGQNSSTAIIVAIIASITSVLVAIISGYFLILAQQEKSRMEMTSVALQTTATQDWATRVSIVGTYVPTSTLDPALAPQDMRLFWDDFENGINPGFGFQGNNFFPVNGQLVTDGVVESMMIGQGWQNYKIQIDLFKWNWGTEIRYRVQDRDNYMKTVCHYPDGRGSRARDCKSGRVIAGVEQWIPNTNFGYSDYEEHRKLEIQAENNVYRILWDGQQTIRFTDDTYSSGGVVLKLLGGTYDDFYIYALP